MGAITSRPSTTDGASVVPNNIVGIGGTFGPRKRTLSASDSGNGRGPKALSYQYYDKRAENISATAQHHR